MSDDLIRRSDAINAAIKAMDKHCNGYNSFRDMRIRKAIEGVPSADRPNATEIMNAYHEGIRKGIAEAYEAYGKDDLEGYLTAEDVIKRIEEAKECLR